MRRLLALVALMTATSLMAQESTPQYVKMTTNRGDVFLELFSEKAPRSVDNFLTYVDSGFYEGTIFHRVVPGFVIQGGGFTSDFQKKPTRDAIQNEADNMLSNARGTLAMARTADPHSGTSQFYVNLVDNQPLDHSGKTHSRAWGYAVFGKVARGMEVVDQIATLPVGAGGPFRSSVPQVEVVIESMTRVDALPIEAPVEEVPETPAPAEEGETP